MDHPAVRSRLALVAVLAAPVAVAAAAAAGAGAPDGTPPSWRSLTDDLPAGVQVWRSEDRRCAVATVTAPASDLERDVLWQALRQALDEVGVALSAEPEPASFERGEMRGVVGLAEVASESGPWQLHACFYRKRDAHVCQSVCQELVR